MSFVNYLINGVSLGSVYAIIALGYTMVYGIAKMLNFAHGDVIMIGSYVVFVATGSMGLPPLAGVLLAVVVCTVLGVVIERVAYKPPSCSFPAGSTDHSHRRQLSASEPGSFDLWSRYQILSVCCNSSGSASGRRTADGYRRNNCYDYNVYYYHGGACDIYKPLQGRTGYAGCIRG